VTKKATPHRSYTLKLDGELEGFEVVIGAMTARDIIRLRSSELTDVDALELVAQRVERHNFGVEDVRDLDYWIVAAILAAWGEAMSEAALPPPTATG